MIDPTSITTSGARRALYALLLLPLFTLACRGPQRDKPEWTLRFTGSPQADGSAQGGVEAADQGVSEPERLAVELSDDSLLPTAEPGGWVRVRRVTEEGSLIHGPTQLGKVGDYLFENERARFLVEADDRVIGPCPYGGNAIDAERVDLEGASDQLGELCLLVNLAQTLKPERFEILEDGREGRALLAVTGHLELLDFINIKGFARSYLPPNLRLGFDTERLLPLTVTVYYAMTPSQPGLRVVTMLRNDGEEAEHFPVGHLIDSGGELTTFNPYNPTGGFGSGGFSAESLAIGPPLLALGFVGQSGGHLYMPDPRDVLQSNRPFPVAGTYITISGVSVSLLGTQRLLSSLLASPAALPTLDGFQHLEPGARSAIGHWHWAGGPALSSMMDEAWREAARGGSFELQTLSGEVISDGAPLPGVKVSLIDARGQTLNQALSDQRGRFELVAPVGEYEVAYWRDGYGRARLPFSLNAADERAELPLVELTPRALLRVRVTQGEAQRPSPARVTVLCDAGPCEGLPDEREADLSQDWLHDDARAVAFVGMDGVAELELPPGTYRVVVSRGPHWSVWPSLEGERVTLEAQRGGAPSLTLEATIDEVVSREGWLSADFHVHGINSPDAPVSLERRVLSFLAEGVDVMVSTDHDFISDYGPTITALGADQLLKHIIGVELTTFDYGHYNGFPLERRPEQRNGGAWDWAGAEGLGATPAQIFEWMHSNEGEQVVMVNHAEGGYFSAMKIDLLRGTSAADPTLSRLAPDVALWDEGFTAMEVYNGYGLDGFNALYRAWLTLLGRGYKVTATAVSDTHKTLSTTAGGPRSWVYLGPESEGWDEAAFVRAVNRGQLIGSSGPLLSVEARALVDGEPAGAWHRLGDTLDLSALDAEGRAVELRVQARTPEWMELTRAHVLSSLTEGLDLGPGAFDESPITPTQSAELRALNPTDEGGPRHERERVYEARFTLPAPATGDGYVVAWVEGEQSMFPVVGRSSVKPFAFSNPILLDGDGGGYDNPPLSSLLAALERRTEGSAQPKRAEPEGRAALERSVDLESLDLSPLIKELEHAH